MLQEHLEDIQLEDTTDAEGTDVTVVNPEVLAEEEHTTSSYEDTYASDCVAIGGKAEFKTALENIHNGVPLNGFPTLVVDVSSKEAKQKDIISKFHKVFNGNLITPYIPPTTGVVRRGLLLLPDLWDESNEEETFRLKCLVSGRTGLCVLSVEVFTAETTPIYADEFADLKKHDITLFLYVPHTYESNTELQKYLSKVYREAIKAEVKCKFLVPKLVRQGSGTTQLPPVTNSLYVFNKCAGDYRPTTEDAYKAVFNAALVENGVPLGSNKRNNELTWELFACNSQDFYAERHAVKVANTEILPLPRSIDTPIELTDTGHFPTFQIPQLPLTVIKAPHASGKTTTLKKFCDEVTSKGDAVIHILPRISLVNQARVSYGAIGRVEMIDRGSWNSTKELSATLFPTDTNGTGGQIAFCIDSLDSKLNLGYDLGKLGRVISVADNEDKKIHLVLDEFPSILNSILTGGCMKSPAQVMNNFQSLLNFIQNLGGSVITLSADLTTTEVGLISSLMGLCDANGTYNTDSIYCVTPKVRQPQPYKRPILLSTSKEATINRIYEAIENKTDSTGTVLVMLNSLKVSTAVSTVNLDEAINTKYPGLKSLVLDSVSIARSNSDASKFMASTPYEQMKLLADYDIVFATSVIEAGLNWDSKEFDDVPDDFVRQIFVIDINGLWGATNLLQASMRVRNQHISCEFYTPKKRIKREGHKDLGFYPSTEGCLKAQLADLTTFGIITKHVDDARETNKHPIWARAYASYTSFEETRLMNPRKTLEVLARSNGHEVVVSKDALPQATANAIRSYLTEIKEKNVALKAALLSSVISIEGAARVKSGETTLTEERMKANRVTPAFIKQRMSELEELNAGIGEAELVSAKVAKAKLDIRKKIERLAYLSSDDALEYEALNCLNVYGSNALASGDIQLNNKAIKPKVKQLLAERVDSCETFLPDVDEAEIKRISRKRKRNELEELMVEKHKAMEAGYLDCQLQADGSSLSAEEWATFACSYMPAFMGKRFLLSVDTNVLTKYMKLIVAELPVEVTQSKVDVAQGLIDAAKCLSEEGIAEQIKRFERSFLMTETDNSIHFVSEALGLDDSANELNTLRARKGLTKNDTNDFLLDAYKKGHKQYQGMKLLSSSDRDVVKLAQALYTNRSKLSALIPSVVKPIRTSDGKSNAIHYLTQVFREIGLGNLRKVGAIKQNGSPISVCALVRKPELLIPTEGYAYTLRKWASITEIVEERHKYLAITDF